MLTLIPTTELVCAELDDKLRIKREIYFDNIIKDESKTEIKQDEMGRFQCPYCKKYIARKNNLIQHFKSCKLKIILNNLDDIKDRRFFKEYEVSNSNNKLELLFHFNRGKQLRMYIPGQAGVGKSYFISQMLKEYVRRYPERKIFIFSQVPRDKDIDSVVEEHELIERELFIRVDLNLFSQINPKTKKVDTSIPIPTINELRNSICIFDDIDEIPNKRILGNLDALKDEIIATGRDHDYQGNDIDIIITNHQTLGGIRTAKILQQSNYIVLFPNGLPSHGIKTVCSKYCNLEPGQINKILSLNERYQYAIIHKESPSFVLEQKKIWLIK